MMPDTDEETDEPRYQCWKCRLFFKEQDLDVVELGEFKDEASGNDAKVNCCGACKEHLKV